eukprot:347690_1
MKSTYSARFDDRECNHLRFNLHTQPSANTIITDVLNLNENKYHKLDTYSSDFLEVMCNDCWINIIPHIAKIFGFVNNYQLQYSETNYIESVDGYHQYLFIHYILMQSNIIQYILKHKELYELMFIVCMRFFRMIYVEKEINFVIQSYILYNKQCKWKRATTEFLKIRRLFHESFIKTTVYWKKKHFKYIESKLDFINFIKNDITKILLQKYPHVQMNQFEYWQETIHYKTLYIIDWFKICNRYKFLDFKQHTNDICLRRLLYIYFQQPLLKYGKVNDAKFDAFIWENWTKIILRFANMNSSTNELVEHIKPLIENNKKQRDKQLDEHYRGKYSYSTKCCLPKCKNFKCDMKIELNQDQFDQDILPDLEHGDVKYDLKFMYKKFYRCKRCRIVTYCSKRCQKKHWNNFGHKKQCDLFNLS